MSKLNDKLDLIGQGFTEAQAEAILNQSDYFHLTMGLIIVLLVIMLIFISPSTSDPDDGWRICDVWRDKKTGEEYFIHGYDRKTRRAKGRGPKGVFLIEYQPDTKRYLSSIFPTVAVLSDNKLEWGDTVWDREVLFY